MTSALAGRCSTAPGSGGARNRPARPRRSALIVAATISVLLTITTPIVHPVSPAAEQLRRTFSLRPTPVHLFGTNELRHDILSQVIWGARASMRAESLADFLGGHRSGCRSAS